MRQKRTEIDFSKHELIIENKDDLLVHHLKKPDSYLDSIMYVNTHGFLAVTGDYSNWIFCREFHPSGNGYCDSRYWSEKLRIGSCQEPSDYDAERTHNEIQALLDNKEEPITLKQREWFENLLKYTEQEAEYVYQAFINNTIGWETESMPYCKSYKYHFLAILDGFEEICSRIAEKEETLKAVLNIL